MALRAIDLAHRDAPAVAPVWALRPAPLATVTPIAPAPRMVCLAAARRERRRWFAVGTLVFAVPLAACVSVLEVVR